MGLLVFIVECVPVVVMVDKWQEMVEDVMDVVVFVEYWCFMLWVGGLAINLSNIEHGFVVSISSWRLRPRSCPTRSISDSSPLSEIMLSSNMLSSISLLI